MADEAKVRAYGQWVQVTIENKTDRTLKISDIEILWGKLYDYPNKDVELPKSSVLYKTIESNGSFSFASCGRSDSASGTEGFIWLQDDESGQNIMKVYWSCPWGLSGNKFEETNYPKGWFPSHTPFSSDGALGNITLTIFKV